MPSKNSNYSSLISYSRHVTMETVKRLERGLNYNYNSYFRRFPASFPVVLGDFGYDVTCQACRENSPRKCINHVSPKYSVIVAENKGFSSRNYLGLFLVDLGLFCHFLPGLALSRSVPSLLWSLG